MNGHPTESLLLQYFDGTLAEADDRSIAAHVDGCAECRQHLAGLTAFESFVARHMPGDALADADMFEVAERALAGRGATAARRRWWGVFGATAVALVAAGVALLLWLGEPPDGARFRLVRYRPEDPLRQGATVRFHLELRLAEPAFVSAWLRFVDGEVVALLPQDGPEVAVQGEVRLPANALLDWEYAAPRVPDQVLVVTSPAPLAGDTRQALGAQWRTGAADVVPPLAAAAGEARVLAVPKNPN